MPLRKGDKFSFVMFGPKPPPEQLRDRSVLLKGAIFDDGSTWGDPKWIQMLILRRASAYRYEAEALQIVMDAKVRSMNPNTLLQRLRSTEQRRLQEAKTTPEMQMAEGVFDEVTLLIRDALAAQLNEAPLIGARSINSRKLSSYTDSAVERLTLRMQEIERAKPSVADVSVGVALSH
jgi:hypothetical protein